jgi:hypothetical protein
MSRNDIEKWQAKRIGDALFPTVNYFVRLRLRMEQLRFPHDDPVYKLVCEAHEGMNRLRLDVHYLSCDGVGRASSDGITLASGRPAMEPRRRLGAQKKAAPNPEPLAIDGRDDATLPALPRRFRDYR